MANKDRTPFDNPVVEWVDSRLPIFTMVQKEYGVFPTPRNFNYFWNFGALAMVFLVLMILTGVFLAMNYTAHEDYAFDSVERIMRDVNFGWLLRYMHMNGAHFFFAVVYIHIFRAMYYGSYKKPRELLFLLGVLIFVLMMATAFMGYTLPWSQMSGWGATVITSLFSAVPLVGEDLVTLLWGGFSVDNPTLNRFYALHYLFPFLIVGVVLLHVWALHVTGSNNPLGIEPKTKKDTLPFHPYYTMKDLFGITVVLVLFAFIVFFAPNSLGHADHYIPFNPLVTPPHIVPEWYFLLFYAILRAITFDFNIYICAGIALTAVAVFPLYTNRDKALNPKPILFFGALGGLLFMLGFVAQEAGGNLISLPFTDFTIITAKLGGVLAMFGAIAALALMPWLDWHKVRSARFRPLYRIALIAFVINAVILGIMGAKVAEQPWVIISQLTTLYYFAFFFVILPLLSRIEKEEDLPTSIYASVVKKAAIVIIACGLLLAAPLTNSAHAAKDAPTPPEAEWSFDGMTGTFDKAALQRGFQVYKEVCSACHAMSRLSYRNLSHLGYSEDQIKAVASQYTVMDGPNDEGEMFERPARPSDRFKSPFANEQQARYGNNGAYPLDLSLIVKARKYGADYIHALLTGYAEPPEGFEMGQGMYYNKYFAGHQIAMAPPLMDGQLMYADGTEATVEQMSHDLSTFLAWAAEPTQDQRKQMGLKVLLFLIFLSIVMYLVKRKIWKDVEH
jgi:quinol-cytochrome oxidoreductase complex cytochrome b subunit/cytochrome c1